MTRTGVVLRMAWRESRAARRRLLLFGSAISVGVAALVAIASFSANLQTAVRREARGLLGGDLLLTSRRPFPPPVEALLDSLARSGAVIARRAQFNAMAYVRGTEGVGLVDVRAVSREFPLYGAVVTSPPGRWRWIDSARAVVVDTSLLIALDARVGDTLEIGRRNFAIAGTASDVPGRAFAGFEVFGPQVYIPIGDVAATGLIGFGSRVRYSALLKLDSERTARRFVGRHRTLLERHRVRSETAGDFESEVTDALSHLEGFAQFVGLVALLLGGIGVASGIGAFISGKLDTIAVLRCLGATRPLVSAIYLAQAAALGLTASAAGAALGVGLQAALPRILRDALPVDVEIRPEPGAIVEGVAIGLAVALLFAIRPLLEVRLVSPLQALRRPFEAEDPAASRRDPLRLAAAGVLAAGVFLLAMSRAERPVVGVGFAVAIGVCIGVLAQSARVAVWVSRRLTRLGGRLAAWPYVVRQGLANLHRPRNQTRTVVIALGFGVALLATLYLVQANLLSQVRLSSLSAGGRPNLVFIDIQPDQADGVAGLIRSRGHGLIQLVPIVPMRIQAINGRTVRELQQDTAGPRREPWALRREYRSTYRDSPTRSERLVKGAWWRGRSTGPPYPVSLTTEIVQDLHVDVGHAITWNVQGAMVETRVASVREVDWARFEPNFFAVFPTAALERAPRSLVALTRVEDAAARARLQRAVAERHGNVISFDVALIQATIERVFGRVALGIRFMAVLSLSVGALVLLGAVAAGRLERIREGALLKTLGATRQQLSRILLAEYLALGLMAGIVGVTLSLAGGWAMTRYVFELDFTVPAAPLAVVLLATTALVAIVGIAASREVFARTAVDVLRDA